MLKQGLAVLGVVALVGCGGGDPLGEQDAQLAFQATQGAMGGQGASPGAITVETPCQDGGKVKFKYNLLGGFSAGANGSVGLEYTVVFRGCKHDGQKISGKITYTVSTGSTATGSSTRWGYEGSLRYSGDINGSCDYDMYGEVTTSDSSVGVSYSGSICGHDASATLNVSASGVTNNVDGMPAES